MVLSEMASRVAEDFAAAGKKFVTLGKPRSSSPAVFHLNLLIEQERLAEIASLDAQAITNIARELADTFVIKHGDQVFAKVADPSSLVNINLTQIKIAATLMLDDTDLTPDQALRLTNQKMYSQP